MSTGKPSNSAPSFDILYEKDVIIENGFFPVDEKSDEGRSEELTESTLTIQVFFSQNDQEMEKIRIRFLSKDDIRFLYQRDYSLKDFEELKEEQDLDIEFDDFPNILAQVLDQIYEGNEESGYKAILVPEDEKAVLHIKQDLGLCTTDIFVIRLDVCNVESIEKVSQERYNELIRKYNEVSTRYKDFTKRISRQDPSILKLFVP